MREPSDLLTSPERGLPRSADNLLRKIDELHSALWGEKEKNKDLFRESDSVIRLSEYLLHTEDQWWREEKPERQYQLKVHDQAEALGRRLGSNLANAKTTIRLLQ